MSISRRLLALSRDSRLALAAAVLSGFLAGLLTIWQAASLSRVVDGVFLGRQSLPDAAGLLRLILIIVFLRALLAWASEVSANAVAVRVKSDLRQRLFDKIARLGPAYTRGERTGELVNAAVEGVEALDAYFSQYLPQLVVAALIPLSILFFIFPRDPLSGLLLLLTAPLIPVFMYLIGKSAEALTRRQWDTLSRLSAHFLDSLQGLTTLKELGRSQDHARSIAEASDRFRDVTLGVLRVTFLSALALELVATVSTAVVAVEVGLRLLYGHLAFQQAFFLLLLAPEFYLPLRMLGLRFHAGMSGTTAARRIFEILDIREQRGVSSGQRVESSEQAGGTLIHHSLFSVLSLSALSYTYPGENQPALRDILLEIKAGEHVALVGPSGAGKSTLAALLLNFISPDGGRLTVDGESLGSIPMDAWRSLVAWVPQTPHLFHDTIAANLRLAKPNATDGQLADAVRAAHLDEFIRSLPDGYETVIGEAGARLSGGQAQRLALARAFLKDASILVLDEPTSSLDPGEENLVESAMHNLMQGRTVITIAHRLNTVYQADKIFVLDQGRLVESGTHRQLLVQGGVYARLVGASGKKMDLTAQTRSCEENHKTVSSVLRGFPLDPQSSIQNPKPPIPNPKSSIQNPKSKISTVHRPSSIVRLLSFLRGSWGWVALSVLLGVLTVGSNVGLMGTAAYLISAAALHPELGALQVAIVGVRFFGIARGVFRYAERLATHNVTFRLLARLRVWFYRALEPLAPARLMQYRSGDLLARIVADVETLENFYVRVVAPPLTAVIVAIGMTIFFNRYDPLLAWTYLLFMLLLGIGLPLLSWTLSRRPGAELISRRAALGSRLVDGIQGLADLLAFGRLADYSRSLAADGKTYGQTQRRLAWLTGLSGGLTVLLAHLGMLAVLAFSIPLVRSGQVPGVMLAVLALAALSGFEAVLPLPLAAQTLSSSMQAARRLFEVVESREQGIVSSEQGVENRDQRAENRDQRARESQPGESSTPLFSSLCLSALCFTYPGNSSPALNGVSFDLHPGQRLAIVGPSGAGKSTLANLLLRFWDCSQGQILLDGRDLREYDEYDVRRLFSVISQRTYFFNETIRQNLLLAQPTATDEQASPRALSRAVREAAQRAQLHEFIAGLPGGYETVIGERGFRLSGGERQRLAIARALLKDAPIFLLDEPTANLDPLTERRFLESLFNLTGDRSPCGEPRRTMLLITHRLVGLEAMDEILVMDGGRIVERGSHARLLKRDGLYRRLWDLQNRMLREE